jgi:hypothetical protein
MDRTQRITLVATGMGLFMIFLDALIVNVALPDIQREFNVGEAGCSGSSRLQPRHGGLHHVGGDTRRPAGRRRWYITGITVIHARLHRVRLAPTLES